MKIYEYNGKKVMVKTADEILKKYSSEKVDLSKLKWSGKIVKATSAKQIGSPYSMSKLLKMIEIDEYHAACVDAIAKNVIMKFDCQDSRVTDWVKNAQFPKRTNLLKLLRQMVKYYISCGNGLLLKARNASGEWVGLERLLPSELTILEAYNSVTGYLEPDYVQVRDNQKRLHLNKDVIHFIEETHLSEAWGLACLPVAINIEILQEIKKFDYNNFKNGLLIDYIFIVKGRIGDDEVLDGEGNPLLKESGQPYTIYDAFEETLKSSKGNDNSHSSALLETGDTQVAVEIHRLREEVKDGSFLSLKKDLREGIFAYHRVPPRLVSQLVAGQLGGDNMSDLILFDESKINPIQWDIATMLSTEFNNEFGWDIEPESFEFGDLREAFLSEEDKQIKELRVKG